MEINTEHYRQLLEEEKKELVRQLSSIGKQIDESGDWVASAPVPDTEEEDEIYKGDIVEEFSDNVETVNVLEERYIEVIAALDRIAKGTYGICEDTQKPIPKKRLDANPAARTCIDTEKEA